MEYKELIGKHIKEARMSLGMEQPDLAEAISVSVTSVSQWENGHTYPRITNIASIAELTGRDVAWFFDNPSSSVTEKQAVSDNEQILIDTYQCLNKDGQAHFLDYATVLRESTKFKK